MDRRIIYPGAIPQDTDQLQQNQDVMTALGFLLQSILGTSTQVDGLACTPTSPASLSVNVAPGSITSYQNLEASNYGSIAADTTRQIVKQGIVRSTTNFTCPAPVTSGQSVVYLIQAQFAEQDGGSTVLPYYNASNPSVPYSGPANSGTAQNTVRRGVCVLNLKVGTAATTGTQATPTPDAGYTALYAITVANGQSTITSPNIVRVAGAPFLDTKLAGKLNATSNLLDVANAATALANLGGVAASFFTGNQLMAATGYQKFPGGLILQWGQVTTTGGGTSYATFPITFPNNFFRAAPGLISGSPVSAVFGYNNATAAGMNIYTNATPGGGVQLASVDYIAIGN